MGAFQAGRYFFAAKKVTKKAPGFQQILRFFKPLRRRKKNSPTDCSGLWPLSIELAQTVFCFSRLRAPKNRDLLKASPVGNAGMVGSACPQHL